MADLRTSQRTPLRCTECARRRVRCNKKVPCAECILRHQSHKCTREVVRVRGKPTVAAPIEVGDGDIHQENSKLRERVADLELALVMSLQNRSGLQATSSSTRSPITFNPEKVMEFEEVEDILDDWDLGIINRGQASTDISRLNIGQPYEILKFLPNREESSYILQFSLNVLGWVHCAVRADQFIFEHETLQNSLAQGDLQGLYDHAWMSIYFSLLTVGGFFMDDNDFSSLKLYETQGQRSDRLRCCRTWYNFSIRQLELSNATARPQLQLVQVTAILTLCNYHFGESFQENNLTSLAINTARELKMDRLGSESNFPSRLSKMPEWNSVEKRELGRRLWWTLVICDWLAALRGRPPRIPSDSFDCILSVGRFDKDVILNRLSISGSGSICSPLLHHVELAKVAQATYEYGQLRQKSLTTLCQFLGQLSELEKGFLQNFDRNDSSDREPLWVSGQKSHYLCTLNYLRLKLSRILLRPNISHIPVSSEIRLQVVNAAFSTVQMGEIPHEYRLLWIFGSATIAAGVFLCLDILFSDDSNDPKWVQKHRQGVETCIATLLPYAHETTICKEGPRALRWLLNLEAANRDGHVRRPDILQTIISASQTSEDHTTEPPLDQRALQANSTWNNADLYDSSGHNLFSPGMSDLLPRTLRGYEQSDFDWIMDTIMSGLE